MAAMNALRFSVSNIFKSCCYFWHF